MNLPASIVGSTSVSWVQRVPHIQEQGALQPIDPYLQWALATDFRGYRVATKEWVSFIARIGQEVDVAMFIEACTAHQWLSIPPVYAKPPKGTRKPLRIVTGHVSRAHLNELFKLPEIECFELGLPVLTPGAQAAAPAKDVPAPMLEARPRGTAPDKVIGIIDYGGPFLHPSFRNGSGTRFFSIWDQGGPLGAPHWHSPCEFGYGRELDARTIDTLAKQAVAGTAAQVYADLDYTLDKDDARSNKRVLRDTHGAHVCDMFAGSIDPLDGVRIGRGKARGPGSDSASNASIVFVQIPLPTLVDSSGGSLNVHILDAIRYIVDRAKSTSSIVINISYGQHAGPHDGSSLLEQAMDELVLATKERVVLVIGAGNGRDDNAHAQVDLSCAGPQVLSWNVPPNDVTDSFLEIWYPAFTAGLSSEVDIEVRPPGGAWSSKVSIDQPGMLLCSDDGTAVAQLVHASRVPNGGDAMALLSLAPTRAVPGSSTVVAPVGVWEIRLSTRMMGCSVPIHAWIEREDLPDTLMRSEFLSHVSAGCTVNGIATGHHCIVVGGIRSSDAKPLPYSGMGPTRDATRQTPCPHVFAECEESEALYGIRAGTMMPGNTLRMAGTSVAAPAAARRIFNAIARQLADPVPDPDKPATRPLPPSATTPQAIARQVISTPGHILR